jgi:hypothetical protein
MHRGGGRLSPAVAGNAGGSMTIVVTATEFTRNFASYQRTVQREPIEVRSHENGYFVSPEDYEWVVPEHLKVAFRDARLRPGRGSQKSAL